MIKLRVETVARDCRPTLPGKVNFKNRAEEIGWKEAVKERDQLPEWWTPIWTLGPI